VKEDEMSVAWERCEMYTIFLLENLQGGDHLEDIGVGGKIILEWILGKQCGNVWTECICLRVRDEWQVLVNTVMNFLVP
jgi:hypothetical protein